MFCMYCGAQIADGSKFCPECGAPVAGAAAQAPVAAQAQQADAQVPPVGAQYPFEVMSAPEAPKKKSVLPVVIVVALLVAAVAAAGYFTNWFGLASGDSVRVVSKTVQTVESDGTSQTMNYRFERGSGGVLRSIRVEATMGDETGTGSIDITSDGDGVPTSVTVHEDEDDYSPSFTIEPTKDQLGRVVTMRYSADGELLVTGTYEYYGDTDNIRAITYSADSENSLMTFISIIGFGEIAPFVSYASTNLLMGYGEGRIEFDENGHMLSYDVMGSTISNPTPDRKTRAGQTLSESDNGYSYSGTYDEFGYQLHSETNYEDSDYSQVSDFEWTAVNNPSRWIATISRLD